MCVDRMIKVYYREVNAEFRSVTIHFTVIQMDITFKIEI